MNDDKLKKDLLIREAEETDAEAIIAYLNIVGTESDNLSFGEEGFPLTVEQEAAFIKSMQADKNSFLLLGMINGEIVANLSLQAMTRQRFAHRGSIGVSVRKKYWNCKIGSDMLKELMRRAKESSLEVLELEVKEDNFYAIKLYEKMGFRKTGTFPRFYKLDGRYYDAYLMTCLL